MSQANSGIRETLVPGEISVLVPYDREASYLYADAIGATRAEALSHFTSHQRFDLSLSEIFHMEFAEATLFFGGATGVRSDLTPCILPFAGDVPFVKGVASTEDECRRILSLIKEDPARFAYRAAGLKVTDRFVL